MCLLEFSMSGVIPKTPTTVFSVLLMTRSVEVCVDFSRLCIYVHTYVHTHVRAYLQTVSIHVCMYIRMYIYT